MRFAITDPVSAQSLEEVWDTPFNLSRSGGATNPTLIPGVNGTLHALWEDRFDGFVYKKYDGTAWEPAVTGVFPFVLSDRGASRITQLQFFPGKEGIIHAFWVDEDSRLIYSRVSSDDFGKAAGWTPPILMAESAVGYGANVDAKGNLHLTYIRVLQTSSLPAGVYYKRTSDNGANWSQAFLIYQSAYLRDLTNQLANISIDSAGPIDAPWVYVAWDNRSRKQVFLSYSKDAGLTWSDPIEVDQPDAGSGSATPFYIKVSALNQEVLLSWQLGEPGSTCVQMYQWSEDGAQSWSDNQPVFENLPGCPKEIQLIHGGAGLTYMLVNLQEQIIMLAWDGKLWSTPQPQGALNSFIDEETFNPVYFECRKFTYLPDSGRLLAIGCDTGSGEDIWLTGRSMGTVDEWFPTAPAWKEPMRIFSSPFPIQSPVVVAGPENGMHVFWSQTDRPGTAIGLPEEGQRASLYYAYWDGERWIVPGTVLAVTEGTDVTPSVIMDAEGRLLAVWNNSQSGEIFFSWASAIRAQNPSEWATPVSIPLPQASGRSPDIMTDPSGAIYVAYAIPLNESRGIYLTKSTDTGNTWSPPVQVFDAAEAGWEMVAQPHLTVTADRKLHVLWAKASIPSGAGVAGLYYSSSVNGGQTWSEATEVVGKPVTWSDLVSTGENQLHRFWQESSRGSMLIWHDKSADSGATWDQPEIVSSFLGVIGAANLSVDASGNLHLLQVAEKGQSDFILQHSVWGGENWLTFENAEIRKDRLDSIDNINAAISISGRLGVVFTGKKMGESQEEPENLIFYTERLLDVSSGPVSIISTPLPRVTETLLPENTPSPQPTATLDLASLGTGQTGTSIPLFNNEYGGLILGATLVAMTIALVVGIRFLVSRFRGQSLKS